MHTRRILFIVLWTRCFAIVRLDANFKLLFPLLDFFSWDTFLLFFLHLVFFQAAVHGLFLALSSFISAGAPPATPLIQSQSLLGLLEIASWRYTHPFLLSSSSAEIEG